MICTYKSCEKKHKAKGYCQFHYDRIRTGISLDKPYRTGVPIERLMRKVTKGGGKSGDCWEFSGPFTAKGYGRITIKGIGCRAHRYAWKHFNNKEIPKGLFVLHSCDNPPCVNPEHLSLGTHQDNMDQMCDRDRVRARGKDVKKRKQRQL